MVLILQYSNKFVANLPNSLSIIDIHLIGRQKSDVNLNGAGTALAEHLGKDNILVLFAQHLLLNFASIVA